MDEIFSLVGLLLEINVPVKGRPVENLLNGITKEIKSGNIDISAMRYLFMRILANAVYYSSSCLVANNDKTLLFKECPNQQLDGIKIEIKGMDNVGYYAFPNDHQ